MVGILSYGGYVPLYRLNREELAKTWGGGFRKGERAVANCDEDSITMAVEAVLDCLGDIDTSTIDGLYFASTTPPYRIKKASTIIAAAADLRRDIFTADFCNSFGSAANTLRAAIDAVSAGSARNVIVVASECQLAPPNSTWESLLGDGAAAFLIGSTDLAVSIDNVHSISSDFLDTWRRERGDPYMRTWEDRFVIEHGYSAHIKEAINSLLASNNLPLSDIAAFAYYGPDSRSHTAVGRSLKIDSTRIQSPMFDTLGNTGSAFFPMILIASLEKATPGDQIVAASYGDGADAFLLRITDRIENLRNKRGIERHLTSKMMLPNYGTYLRFRNLMEWERTPMPEGESSLTVMWRDEKALTRGYGHKCKVCGHVQFPPQRICMWCQAVGQFDDVRFADKKGKLFTFSLDDRAVFALDLPNVLAVVDIDGGGRVYGQMTDRDPDNIYIGMPVEMTFRKYHEDAGFNNYAWKCRPVRC